MSKMKQVRWNGGPQDPETITQHGITFEKGVWTSVPDDSDKEDDRSYELKMDPSAVHGIRRPQKPVIHRLRDNPQFEVRGMEPEEQPNDQDLPPARLGGPVRAPATTYRVQSITDGKSKKPTGWVVVGDNGQAVDNGDVYVDESSAQVVADAMNKVPAPAKP